MGYRVWDGEIEGVRPTLRVSSGGLVIGVDPGLVLAADLQGRPWRIADGASTYRWSLNGEVLAITRDAEGARRYDRMSRGEAAGLWKRVRDRLAPLLGLSADRLLEQTAWQGEGKPGDDAGILRAAFERLARTDAETMERDARRFGEVYSPVGILPPDQYRSLVVQVTLGCSFNTCTFCTFYRGFPFSIRRPDELRDHLAAVDSFLGEGLRMRGSIFLGDANALVVPFARLEPLVEVVREHYARTAPWLEGMHAFLDGFSGTRKSVEEYRRLKALGLQRVSVGMESGHAPLLEWLRKPGTPGDVTGSVLAMKEAGLAVTLIVLLGAGGRRFEGAHAHDTARLLAGLPLDGGDIVYFSEFVDQPGAPYGVIADREGVEPLDGEAMQRQRAHIAGALRPGADGGPRTAVYDIREFTY